MIGAPTAMSEVTTEKVTAAICTDTRVTFTGDEIQRSACMIRHALGAVEINPRPNWGYRNRYCLQKNGDPADLITADKMIQAGLVEEIPVQSPVRYFRATENGMRLVGLSEREIRRIRKSG